jgi:hypothetical protein
VPYKRLDAKLIEAQAQSLHEDIQRDFAGRGIDKVCAELVQLTSAARAGAARIKAPNKAVRLGASALALLIGAGLIAAATRFRTSSGPLGFSDFVQMLEAAINDVVLIGAGIWFLFSVENRLNRRRALAAIHQLRSIAHVIDMLQLTKNVGQPRGRSSRSEAGASPAGDLSTLTRYLGFCSEMLSLTGKTAVLYVQDFDDGEVLSAVTEVEELTTGLSRKIWQKVMVFQAGGANPLGPGGPA